MPRSDFDRHLREVEDDLLGLGSLVEDAIAKALDALMRRDLEASRQVVEGDSLVNARRFQLEERCIELIATQQPMAGDLRTLIAILHIAIELERIGDYAEGIGKISLMMGDATPLKPLEDIPPMGEKATAMLRRSLEALVRRDAALATAVCKDDDEVDALYDHMNRELLFIMIQDPRTIQQATYQVWVTHDLERIADRATNIAEQVIYLVTGEMTEINVSKY